MVFAMSLFTATEWLVLTLWFVAIIAPLVYAVGTRTSVAMGITVSVLLGAVVQVLWTMLYNWGLVQIWVWSDFVLIPVRVFEPAFVHTLISAGFLHSQGDMMHVLGNVIILALVGVPLEQRLGSKRFANHLQTLPRVPRQIEPLLLRVLHSFVFVFPTNTQKIQIV